MGVYIHHRHFQGGRGCNGRMFVLVRSDLLGLWVANMRVDALLEVLRVVS